VITDAPDRVDILHSADTGDPPAWTNVMAQGLRAKVTIMGQSDVLAANAEGLHDYRATHLVRVEYHTEVVPRAVARRRRDRKHFLLLNVRECNYLRHDRPDHLLCDAAVLPDDTS
jgi:hypothetical protein